MDLTRKALKDVKNTLISVSTFTFSSKRESLDDSLIQVIPEVKDIEKRKEYNNLVLANETGICFDENSLRVIPLTNKSGFEFKTVLTHSDKQDLKFKHNPQFVIEYINDIFQTFKDNEHLNSCKIDYMKNLVDLNSRMRAILVDWLIEVHLKFHLVPETLFLTVNLIDRFLSLSNSNITRSNFQLLGISAMLIASKYEEIYAPEIRDFVYVTDKTYSRHDIIKMESTILNTLNYEILTVSSYRFLERLSFLCGDNKQVFYLAQFILELSLVEYRMIFYLNSIKACSAIVLARKILKLNPSWPSNVEKISGYSEISLRNCVKELCLILDHSKSISLKNAKIKFSKAQYLMVSNISVFH